MKAQQMVEAWRRHLRRRFPLFPHLVDQQVAKVWTLKASKNVTPEDLQSLEQELTKLAKKDGRLLRSVASEPALSTRSNSVAGSLPRVGDRPHTGTSRSSSQHSFAQSDGSFRSQIQFIPKLYYPKQPLQKPPDVWDHITKFDVSQYWDAETNKPKQHKDYQEMYKKQLDAQLEELQYKKQSDKTEVLRDKEALDREGARYQDNLQKERDQRNQVRQKLAKEMLHAHNQRDRFLERLRQEKADLKNQMETVANHYLLEENERLGMLKERLEERKKERTQENIEREEMKRRKLQEERDYDKALFERYCADQDMADRNKKKQADDRWAKMQKNTEGGSKQVIAERKAKEEFDSKILQRDLAMADENFRRKTQEKEDTHKRLTKEMVQTLDDQIWKKQQKTLEEQVELRTLGKRFDEDCENMKKEEMNKAYQRYLDRKKLDEETVELVNDINVVHQEHRVRPDLINVETAFNQPILRTMVRSGYAGFKPDSLNPTAVGRRNRNIIPSYAGSISEFDDDSTVGW